MTKEEFEDLRLGDLVRSVSGSRSLIVTGNFGGRVTAVLTFDLTNPLEWELVRKARYFREDPVTCAIDGDLIADHPVKSFAGADIQAMAHPFKGRSS